jgi:hypothetical protein
VGAERAGQLEAVHPGHAQIGEQQVRPVHRRQFVRRLPVRCVRDLVPGPAQQPRENHGDVLVVLGNEYYGHVRSGTLVCDSSPQHAPTRTAM